MQLLKFAPLVAFAAADNDRDSGSEAASLACDGHENMTLTFTHDRPTFLHEYDGTDTFGTCAGLTVTTTGSAGAWSHEFNIPADCADSDGDFALKMFFTAVDGLNIIVDDTETQIFNCPDLLDIYNVTFDFDQIDMYEDEMSSEAATTAAVTFTLERTDSDFIVPETDLGAVDVGETVYFKITADSDKYEFDLGDCSLEGSTDDSFKFIDMYDDTVCLTHALNANAEKVVDGDNIEWQISFDIFRFADDDAQDYTFSCNVFACVDDDDDSNTCLNNATVATEYAADCKSDTNLTFGQDDA